MTGINPTSVPVSGGVQAGPAASSNPRLKALEEKLDRLKKEKEEAVRNHDRDRKRELEHEIRQVERQIEQLKKKEKQKQKEDKDMDREKEDLPYGPKLPDSRLGNVIDLYG